MVGINALHAKQKGLGLAGLYKEKPKKRLERRNTPVYGPFGQIGYSKLIKFN